MKSASIKSPIDVAYPAVVLSDLHLAHPASYLTDPAMIEPLLEGAATVLFNGDSAELLNLRRRVQAHEKLAQLAEVCRRNGATPIFLSGNHDPGASSLHYLDLRDGAVFLTHGDTLHPALAPWSRDAPAMIAERRRLRCGMPEPQTLEELCLLTKRCATVALLEHHAKKEGLAARLEMVGKFAFKPWRIAITFRYWANVSRYSRRLRERFRPRCRLMLIGHTHRAGVWPNRDFTLVNTGSYQPLSKALVVRLDEETAIIHDTFRDKGLYRPGRELHRVPLNERMKAEG